MRENAGKSSEKLRDCRSVVERITAVETGRSGEEQQTPSAAGGGEYYGETYRYGKR
jgi:hypothetical protein